MIPKEQLQEPLYPFRRELKLFRGPDESDGSPTFNLFDPVRSKYFKINWEQSLIFQFFRGGMSACQVAEEINKNTTVSLQEEEIALFFDGMARAGLLRIPQSSEQLLEQEKKRKSGYITWFLLHYLYFRVPLVNPDSFLTKTLPYVRPLASKLAFLIYALLSLAGVFAVLLNFETYLGTFLYFFSFEGFLAYAACIIFIKVIHEFSHAYTAKAFGIKVPTMGIVFLVLFPALYTDVTHGWTLRNRSHRLAITIAGVLSELVMAGIASLLWAITEPGMLNSALFIVSSSTWIISLFINLNPAMRFDGYYLLSDLWGIDNMQSRAFTYTRYQLRKTFLGIDVPPPEQATKQRRTGFLIYTIYTWVYRLFLYTAIAIFVYYKFTKALGVFLFFIEILIFFLWPIYWEAQELYRLRDSIHRNPRMTATLSVLGLLFLWLLIPLPHASLYPAITEPINEQIIYAPESAFIEKIFVSRGQELVKGAPIIELSSPLLTNQIAVVENQILTAEKESNILSIKNETRTYLAAKEAEKAGFIALLKQLKAQEKQLLLSADEPGVLFEWDMDLRPGLAISKDRIFGKLASSAQTKVIFFISDREIDKIKVGDSADFIISNPRATYSGSIIRISPINDAVLRYPALLSHQIFPTVKDKEGNYRLVDSYYAVEVRVEIPEENPLRWGVVGEAEVTGRWSSILVRWGRSFSRIFWRESGA